mgnify:FL=1
MKIDNLYEQPTMNTGTIGNRAIGNEPHTVGINDLNIARAIMENRPGEVLSNVKAKIQGFEQMKSVVE